MRKLCGVTCVDFQTPSRNIKCLASASPPSIVGCDIDSGLEPTPPSARCPAGFGQESGIVCVNGAGHGFFLSRQRWTTF